MQQFAIRMHVVLWSFIYWAMVIGRRCLQTVDSQLSLYTVLLFAAALYGEYAFSVQQD
jgi:hypothetical protein